MSRLWLSVVKTAYDLGNNSGCHQNPERSFKYKGHQFPVCARCTGVFVGEFLAVIINVFTNVKALISVICLMVMGVDWGVQELNIKKSTNPRRFITGILGGFGLFNLYCMAAKKILEKVRK